MTVRPSDAPAAQVGCIVPTDPSVTAFVAGQGRRPGRVGTGVSDDGKGQRSRRPAGVRKPTRNETG